MLKSVQTEFYGYPPWSAVTNGLPNSGFKHYIAGMGLETLIQEKAQPVILTIAGFDPSSGAGITADLMTFAAHGCYGVACVTALTVQSTQGVRSVEPVSGQVVRDTLAELARDIPIAAIKIGMLGSAEAARAICGFQNAFQCPIMVLDPILKASSGTELLGAGGVNALKSQLMRLTSVITPNVAEASALTGLPVTDLAEMKLAAKRLQEMGARNVVVTGGHMSHNTDVILTETGSFEEITGQFVESKNTHGTGCAYSSALTCNLLSGKGLLESAKAAKEYVLEAIEHARPFGKGKGPLNHLYGLKGNV